MPKFSDWLNAVLRIGAPTALLMFVVFWLTGDFNVRLRAIEEQHGQAAAIALQTKGLTERSLSINERILWTLRIMCANSAKTNTDRDRCLREN